MTVEAFEPSFMSRTRHRCDLTKERLPAADAARNFVRARSNGRRRHLCCGAARLPRFTTRRGAAASSLCLVFRPAIGRARIARRRERAMVLRDAGCRSASRTSNTPFRPRSDDALDGFAESHGRLVLRGPEPWRRRSCFHTISRNPDEQPVGRIGLRFNNRVTGSVVIICCSPWNAGPSNALGQSGVSQTIGRPSPERRRFDACSNVCAVHVGF